jgi:hypothetical protein
VTNGYKIKISAEWELEVEPQEVEYWEKLQNEPFDPVEWAVTHYDREPADVFDIEVEEIK